MTDLISGEVQLYISDLIVAMPHVLAGKVRALGVTSLVRSSVMPDVPTIAESGLLPKYEALGLFGLFGPAGLPPTILAKLNAAVNKVANDPELRNRLSGLGLEVQPSTPAELAARMSAEKAVWMRVTKAAGMSPQ
jgi:tripartite-type tricarboxylate transporter receptor subunit TctC